MTSVYILWQLSARGTPNDLMSGGPAVRFGQDTQAMSYHAKTIREMITSGFVENTAAGVQLTAKGESWARQLFDHETT